MLYIFYIILLLNNSKFSPLREENYSKEYSNLLFFIKNNGGYINHKLIPSELSKFNRFVLAKEKINKNEILLFIPHKISISKLNSLVHNKCIEAYGLDEEYDYACLVYFMTIDKFNSTSIFKPYYNYLPEFNKADFLTNFTEKEIEIFKETGITEGIKYYKFFYNKALEPVKGRLKKICNQKNIKYEKIEEEFEYNYDLTLTRNFGRPGSFYDINTMVPYLDLINHSDKNNTYWFYEDKKEGYTLIAMRDINKNEEITDSYGEYPNSILYKTYGFVIPGNIYHEHIKLNICNEFFDLNIDNLKNNVKNIFKKKIGNYKNIEETKKCILEDLNIKKSYYLNLYTNRFCMKVIIEEHLDIINKYIYEVKSFNI